MVPVALAEVEGAESSGSLEIPIALTKVEGVEPGGAPVVVVYVQRRQVMSSSGRSSIWSGSS